MCEQSAVMKYLPYLRTRRGSNPQPSDRQTEIPKLQVSGNNELIVSFKNGLPENLLNDTLRTSELATIIGLWAVLPEHIRQAIWTLVQAAMKLNDK